MRPRPIGLRRRLGWAWQSLWFPAFVLLLSLVVFKANMADRDQLMAKEFARPTCDLHPGTLSLALGFAHEEYWWSGREGRIGEGYAKKNGKARLYMLEHDGDWCAFGIAPCDQEVTIPKGSRIVLTLADGSEVVSTDILAVGWEPVREYRSVADTWVVFGPNWEKDKSWYGLSIFTGGWILYVRFPEASCLTGKAADRTIQGVELHGREFKSPPVAIRLERGGA